MNPLATHHLTAGWATFGQVLPPGQAWDGLRLGTELTQCDVKKRWPDGSIRFAIVTAPVAAEGDYELYPWNGLQDTFPDTARPDFQLLLYVPADGSYWGVGYYPESAGDPWLDGPLVRERRQYLPLYNQQGEAHPFLRCVLDVRQFLDGQWRYDVCVENCLDAAGDLVVYDAYVLVDGDIVWSRPLLTHPYLCRWRMLVEARADRAAVTPTAVVIPDLAPAVAAQALPRYSPDVASWVDYPWGPAFEPLGQASLLSPMDGHGGRQEIGPYPDWTARYLAHRDPDQLYYVLAHGDLAGSWPVHVRNDDGSLVSIDDRPLYWHQFSGGQAQDGPTGNLGATGPLIPDVAHQPSLAYVPYLVTGDRYYADELAFWANFDLLNTWAAARTAAGYLFAQETRGFGWGVQRLAEAAGALPDASPLTGYFAEKLTHNLQWCDGMQAEPAAYGFSAYGTCWHGGNIPPEGYDGPIQFSMVWQHIYLCIGITVANNLGFPGGESLKAGILAFHCGMLKDPQFGGGAPMYRLPVADYPGGPGYTEYWQAYSFWGEVPFAGYYGTEAWIAAVMAGDPDAQAVVLSQPQMPVYLAERSAFYWTT